MSNTLDSRKELEGFTVLTEVKACFVPAVFCGISVKWRQFNSCNTRVWI